MDGGHLVMEDVDAAPGISSKAVSITWTDIALGSASCVTFSGLFAAGEGKVDFDDYIHVDYSTDAGVRWEPLVHFEGAGFTGGNANQPANGFFYPDLDLDGEGDASEAVLSDTAVKYSAVSQPLNGASAVSLRLSVQVDSGDENAGMDTFTLAMGCGGEVPLTTAPATTTATVTSTTSAELPTTLQSTIALKPSSTTTEATTTTTTTSTTTAVASTTSAAAVTTGGPAHAALSLPFTEPFNSRDQMDPSLSDEFGGDGGQALLEALELAQPRPRPL